MGLRPGAVGCALQCSGEAQPCPHPPRNHEQPWRSPSDPHCEDPVRTAVSPPNAGVALARKTCASPGAGRMPRAALSGSCVGTSGDHATFRTEGSWPPSPTVSGAVALALCPAGPPGALELNGLCTPSPRTRDSLLAPPLLSGAWREEGSWLDRPLAPPCQRPSPLSPVPSHCLWMRVCPRPAGRGGGGRAQARTAGLCASCRWGSGHHQAESRRQPLCRDP